jgi:hypothetical protein
MDARLYGQSVNVENRISDPYKDSQTAILVPQLKAMLDDPNISNEDKAAIWTWLGKYDHREPHPKDLVHAQWPFLGERSSEPQPGLGFAMREAPFMDRVGGLLDFQGTEPERKQSGLLAILREGI